jgi:type IV secretion system protein TrbJ
MNWMIRNLSKSLAVPMALLMAILSWPQATHAGVIAGFATEWTQVLNNVQLILTYIRQGEMLREQIVQSLDMARNSKRLPSQRWGNIAADIAALSKAVQVGRGLAYTMANLDVEFHNRYQGYGYRPNNFYNEYQSWSGSTMDTLLGTLKAANLQSTQMGNEEGLLTQLRSMSETTEGRMQALQVELQMNEQITQQLQKLRQLMLADIQSKQAFQAAEMQLGADRAAAEQQLLTRGGARASGFTYLGGNQ